MGRIFDQLPDWEFTTHEATPGVYEVKAVRDGGVTASSAGTDPERMLQELVTWAKSTDEQLAARAQREAGTRDRLSNVTMRVEFFDRDHVLGETQSLLLRVPGDSLYHGATFVFRQTVKAGHSEPGVAVRFHHQGTAPSCEVGAEFEVCLGSVPVGRAIVEEP